MLSKLYIATLCGGYFLYLILQNHYHFFLKYHKKRLIPILVSFRMIIFEKDYS